MINLPADRYDMDLRLWEYHHTLAYAGDQHVFRSGDDLRLGRYLLTEETVREYQDGSWVLVNNYGFLDEKHDVLGSIWDIELAFNSRNISYWIVKKDEEIDIFLGNARFRPVKWQS